MAETESVTRYEGFAEQYDIVRPAPPVQLIPILCSLARVDQPQLVVDLASGTGAAAGIWAGRAERVIAVEPNQDMIMVARERLPRQFADGSISFLANDASSIDLPDAVADIVTCSQALHWLEPTSTFSEVARILRTGGVFAAFDYEWPPITDWEVYEAFVAFVRTIGRLGRSHRTMPHYYNKYDHIPRMRGSGHFRSVFQFAVALDEQATGERLIELACSRGGFVALQSTGVDDEALGLARLRRTVEQRIGTHSATLHWTYQVRIGVH